LLPPGRAWKFAHCEGVESANERPVKVAGKWLWDVMGVAARNHGGRG